MLPKGTGIGSIALVFLKALVMFPIMAEEMSLRRSTGSSFIFAANPTYRFSLENSSHITLALTNGVRTSAGRVRSVIWHPLRT